MEEIEANAKKYEMISVERDPYYDKHKASINIVKKFIIDRQLIIYGGTAIDYALRLTGDCIYPDDMLAIPDLDFFSSNPVGDAYDLADILYAAGYEDVRAIRALHITTMKVDADSNKHWVADISYYPKDLLPLLPTVVYDGMLVLHPNYQRIDTHHSLSFPFEEPPREVIFNRWKKDIERFNKLNAKYPVGGKPGNMLESKSGSMPKNILENMLEGKLGGILENIQGGAPGHILENTITISSDYAAYVFHGIAGYALLYCAYLKLVDKPLDSVVPAIFDPDGTSIKISAPGGSVDFLHFDPVEIIQKHKLKVKQYEPILDKIPPRFVSDAVTIWSTEYSMVVIASVHINNSRYKSAGLQTLLYHFSACAQHDVGIDKNLCWSLYTSLLIMAEHAGNVYSGKFDTIDDSMLNKSIWLPNVYVYGKENLSESVRSIIALNTPGSKLIAPSNYYPGRKKDRPKFDYSSEIYAKAGRFIE